MSKPKADAVAENIGAWVGKGWNTFSDAAQTIIDDWFVHSVLAFAVVLD